jgi:hypothetical protein
MRLFVLLLLLANVAFFAWTRYMPETSSTESQLVLQQIHPEAIRLLSPREVAALASRKIEQAKVSACIEWGALNAAEAMKARSALEPLAARISEHRVEEAAGWWVYMPPQGSRQAAIQKAAELKRIGIDEFFIVQEDPKYRFAISLGVYRTEAAATAHLEQLRNRGVRTALVGARQTPVPKVYLQLRDVPESAQARLAELRQSVPGTQLRECVDRASRD